MALPASPVLSDNDLQSRNSFSEAAVGNMSFAERKIIMAKPTTSPLVEGDDSLLRSIDRPPPGDMVSKARKPQPRQIVKQRSNFFEDAFSVKESNPAKERVQSDSIVMAEVKTNVIISDEFTFITELSYHLSTRYQRPVASIVVTLQHGACMLFGGTFDPAYTMTVTALQSQLLPTTNKRNAALIQKHMEEAIGVNPARGFLRFSPIVEENIAVGGRTLAAEIDDLEKNFGSVPADVSTSLVSRRSRAKKKLSVKSLGNYKAASSVAGLAPELTPPTSASDEPTPVPPLPTNGMASEKQLGVPPALPISNTTQHQAARRKKSFVASLFGRYSGKADVRPSTADTSAIVGA